VAGQSLPVWDIVLDIDMGYGIWDIDMYDHSGYRYGILDIDMIILDIDMGALSRGPMDSIDPMDPFSRGFDAFLGGAVQVDPIKPKLKAPGS